MNRILIIGESPFAPTRLGNTIREIGSRLHNQGIDVAAIGLGYTGWPFTNSFIPFPLYPWIGPPNNPHTLEDILAEWKPDTLLLIGAPLLFGWLKDFQKRNSYRIVLHTAFISLPLNTVMYELYELADTIIVNSRFEEKAIRSVIPQIPVSYIPYGIVFNRHNANPKKDSSENKQYGVACIAKDIPKIDFPSLLKAWGIVAKKNRNIAFGIFSDPSQLASWNIPDMLEVYGIQNSTFVQAQPENNFGFDSIGVLYSSIDLLVLPHQDETLNVNVIEAAHFGVPLLTAGGGATEEYIPESAMRLERSDVFVGPPMNTRYTVFDAEEIADKILIAHQIGKKREKRYKSIQKKCKTETVFKKWLNILNK